MEMTAATIATIHMDIDINAPVEKVWATLTENIGDWWPAEFYAGGEAGKRQYALDAVPGGRMGESWEGGGGTVWGTVIGVDPMKVLQIHGHVFPNWGGPTQWYGTWTLEATDKGTTLSFTESGLGRVSESGMREKDKGWLFLWRSLKAHAEGVAPPAWED